MKIIENFNTQGGALIECSCGVRFFIFGVDSEKQCSCGKTYIVRAVISEVVKELKEKSK